MWDTSLKCFLNTSTRDVTQIAHPMQMSSHLLWSRCKTICCEGYCTSLGVANLGMMHVIIICPLRDEGLPYKPQAAPILWCPNLLFGPGIFISLHQVNCPPLFLALSSHFATWIVHLSSVSALHAWPRFTSLSNDVLLPSLHPNSIHLLDIHKR